MKESSADPTEVFGSYGLCSKGWWGFAAESGLEDTALSFCTALGRLGGIYSAFGRFLCWRSDLIDTFCIESLRQIKLDYPAVPVSTVQTIVRRELGEAGAALAAGLEGAPLWNTVSRTAYLSKHKGKPMVVEVARDPVTPEDLTAFEHTLGAIVHPEMSAIVSPDVLAQFRQWLRNGENFARERSFLNVLNQYGSDSLAGYPVPVPELSTSTLLVWPTVEGRPVSELIGKGDEEVAVLIASAILEQFYSLSMVDTDLDLDAMIVDANQRLHFLRLNNPVAVPPSMVNMGIRYGCAVLAGNASLSAQALIRLTISRPPLDLEKQLMDEFSSIDPELKINRWFPGSAAAFESNWRALTKMETSRPLFLDCLQRNLVAAGYWNSDAVRAGAPQRDAIMEAQSPVVGRLVRTQFGMLLNRDSALEWAVGSGLFMFGALKEMNRLVEEFRDNDLTVGVDLAEPVRRESRQSRLPHAGILGSLLVVLLLSLLWGGTAPEPWPAVLKILAVSTLPAMFWVVSRMG